MFLAGEDIHEQSDEDLWSVNQNRDIALPFFPQTTKTVNTPINKTTSTR